MFGKKRANRPAKISSLVGTETEISGDVSFSGGLHVDGTVKGNVVADIDADALLILSETGVIQGEVRAPFIIINGTVNGDVHSSERLELTTKARIKGNVYYNLIEMSIGAEVNGNLIHYVSNKPPQREAKSPARTSGLGAEPPTKVGIQQPPTPNAGSGKPGAAGHGY
jgi:cytoskeletal protein CcmA (bactofilin family)